MTRRIGCRIAQSVGVLAAWAAVVGMGTFGTFGDPGSSLRAGLDDQPPTGAIRASSIGQSLPMSFGGLVPGASTTRQVTLVNDGDRDLASIVLRTVATTSSLLDADRSRGLQMTVESCSIPWSGDSGCAGDRRTVVPAGPVVRAMPLTGPASLTANRSDHLAVTVTLPGSAGKEFQGQRSALTLTFTAVQR